MNLRRYSFPVVADVHVLRAMVLATPVTLPVKSMLVLQSAQFWNTLLYNKYESFIAAQSQCPCPQPLSKYQVAFSPQAAFTPPTPPSYMPDLMNPTTDIS